MQDLGSERMVGIERRLDVLIYLQLDQTFPSMTQKVEKLSQAGLSAAEIGRIIGKPNNYVTATLSQGKKRKTKGQR
jgi:hypothetical protein